MPKEPKRKPGVQSKRTPKSGSRPKPIRHKSIKEVRKDRLKSFVDRRLIEALRHEVREHILAVLNERVASTVEIGDEIELDVTAFYSHVEVLQELGLIELVERRQVTGRGAKESFYRAKPSIFFDDRTWELAPDSFKWDFDAKILQSMLDDVVMAFNDKRSMPGTIGT